jgi:hypothetical protein
MIDKNYIKRLTLEAEQKWIEEGERIPFIQFPADWKVQVIPPFGDAAVRFRVLLPCGRKKSVYLDVRSSLGFFGESMMVPTPYWEVYPYRGDVIRCHRESVGLLLSYIADESEDDDAEV